MVVLVLNSRWRWIAGRLPLRFLRLSVVSPERIVLGYVLPLILLPSETSESSDNGGVRGKTASAWENLSWVEGRHFSRRSSTTSNALSKMPIEPNEVTQQCKDYGTDLGGHRPKDNGCPLLDNMPPLFQCMPGGLPVLRRHTSRALEMQEPMQGEKESCSWLRSGILEWIEGNDCGWTTVRDR